MPRPAKSVIALFLFSSLGFAGCSAPAPVVTAPAEPVASAIDIEYPGDFRSTMLALSYEGGELRVGDSAVQFTEAFPRPPRTYVVNDRPPKLPESFQTRGWQTNDLAVATILVEDHVVATVVTEEGVDLERVESEIQAIERRYGPPTQIVNGDYRFAFWSDEGSILMVGNAIELNGRMSMTQVIGHPRMMDFLNMTLADAQSQVRQAQERRNAYAAEQAAVPN